MLKIADILSDLTSLRAGDPAAAMDLVMARPPSDVTALSTRQLQKAHNTIDSDVDLARAQDLLDLHANVKLAHREGLDHALLQARQQVDMALRAV
ncbi:hypothetical protein KCU95_g14492, partial [Aureobasidium melanogenum]